MANPKELRKARQRAEYAAWALERIEALPRRVGQKVLWRNGTVWTRHGDDDWRASDLEISYSSEHVATINEWKLLTED